MTVATRLRLARENAGLSQAQVARIMNLHRPTISEIEAGRRRVSAEELAQLSEIYEVSPDWLVGVSSSPGSARVELAARELSKLRDEDLDRVLNLIQTLRSSKAK
jgi:transcriptional regulator with XRE-family HTH domain